MSLFALASRIDALLPQTQCRRCTYAGCHPYAEAIARGEADIDQCPPGGDETARALAALLGRTAKPVNPAYGTVTTELVALIDESRCIGCARCLPACPVDAIVGAKRRMHSVIAGQCTGCELCLPPCPVDCIAMVPAPAAVRAHATARMRADDWRERHARHEKRLSAAADSERRAFEAARAQARAGPG